MGNGIGIGVFGFILVLGIVMDILGKDRCVRYLDKYWFHWGGPASIISYIVVVGCLIPFIVNAAR